MGILFCQNYPYRVHAPNYHYPSVFSSHGKRKIGVSQMGVSQMGVSQMHQKCIRWRCLNCDIDIQFACFSQQIKLDKNPRHFYLKEYIIIFKKTPNLRVFLWKLVMVACTLNKRVTSCLVLRAVCMESVALVTSFQDMYFYGNL